MDIKKYILFYCILYFFYIKDILITYAINDVDFVYWLNASFTFIFGILCFHNL